MSSSPFIPSSFTYGDLPYGGSLTPIIMAPRVPASTDILPQGYLWLSDQTLGGNGALYYQSGFTSGAPNWVLLSQAGAGVFTTVTASGNITSTAGNISATAGSVSAGTTLTASLGNITATNGNLSLGTAGNKIVIATGSNASVGTSAAMTAGVVTVATTASSATAKIFYSRNITGGTPGNVSITAQDGTGFTLTSTSATETSTFNYWIINL